MRDLDAVHNHVDVRTPGPLTHGLVDEKDWREDEFTAQQHYRQLLDHTPDMIVVHENGRFVYINPAGVRWMAGTSEEQFLGHRLTEFVHPGEIHAVLARIASLRHVGDTSGPAPETLLCVDGTTMDVEAVSVLTNWKGKLAYLVIMRDVSAQKAAEETLRYQAALVNHVSDAIIAITSTGIVTSWNPAAEAIYRWPAGKALGLPVNEVVGAPLDPAAIIASGGVLHAKHRASDGTVLSVRVSAATMDDGFVLVCTDQTALMEAEQHFQTVVASLAEGIAVLGSDGRVESVNPAALRILGVNSPDFVYDSAIRTAMIPIFDAQGRVINPDQRALIEFLQTQAAWTDFTLGVDRPSDGQRIWLSANGQLLNPDDPQNSSMLLSFIDITAQHTASQRLAYEATHDALTGLPNRVQLLSHLSQHIDERGSTGLGAVFFIDLNNFKEVNDSLGHDAGDIMLKTAAHRLKAAFRAGDVLGRLGGDEFVALIQGKIAQAELDRLTERVDVVLAKPIRIGDDEWTISASIGIALIGKDDSRESSQILRDAETAMYQAKSSGGRMSRRFTFQLPRPANTSAVAWAEESGRNRWAVYDSNRDNTHDSLSTAMRAGLGRGEFFLEYQPIVRLTDDVVVGAEALLRWAHPTLGTLLPGRFIDLAENSGLIVPMTAYVLEQACRQARDWRDNNTDHQPFVSVNICAHNICDPGFLPLIKSVLADTGLPAHALQLELTENISLNTSETSVTALQKLSVLGARIALDDFGTGFSNLTYLRTLPIHVVKLDGEFIQNLDDSLHRGPADEQITKAVIDLAHTLGLAVIAEQVETPSQAARLLALGCDAAQGWHFAKPQPANKIREALCQRRQVTNGDLCESV